MATTSRVLAIVPCFNEAGSIGALLREFEVEAPYCDVLVVDDGSVDGTHEHVAAPARCIRLPANLGIGGAVQTGIKYAYAHNYDYCIQIDGDGQHPPAEIARVLAASERARSAIMVGSRYLRRRDGFQSSFLRRLGGRLIGLTLRIFFGGARVTDPTSGMRMMDRRAMRFFALHYPTDYPEPISLGWAFALGLPVCETQVTMRERQAGVSSIRFLKTASYMVRVIVYIGLARFMVLPLKRRHGGGGPSARAASAGPVGGGAGGRGVGGGPDAGGGVDLQFQQR